MRLRFTDLGILTGFFLIALVLQWPAASWITWLENQGSRHWRLVDVDGHPWHGQGILLARSGEGVSWRSVQHVHWQWLWRALASGRMAFAMTLERGQMEVSAGRDGLTLDRLDVQVPAADMALFLPGMSGRYAWQGGLQIHGAGYHCDWAMRTCRGEIDVQWRAAGVREIAGDPLGDYHLRFVHEGETLRWTISPMGGGGRLHVDGQGRLFQGRLEFSGEARAASSDDESLISLLKAMGRSIGPPGHYRFDYRG